MDSQEAEKYFKVGLPSTKFLSWTMVIVLIILALEVGIRIHLL